MSDFIKTGNNPANLPIRYGSNAVATTVSGFAYTPSQDIASVVLAGPAETVPTQGGNGIEFTDGGIQVITAPVASLDSTLVPNSPVGSLCLDSSLGLNQTLGTSDVWLKTGSNATNWAPLSQAWFLMGHRLSGGGIIGDNTATYIDLSADNDRLKSHWGNSYGGQNSGVGNKTSSYTDGFYVKVPFPSYYFIWFSLGIEPPSSNLTYLMYASIYINGTEVKRGIRNNHLQTTTGYKVSQTSVCVKLVKGDIISFVGLQTSGANRTVADSFYTNCGVVNLGG